MAHMNESCHTYILYASFGRKVWSPSVSHTHTHTPLSLTLPVLSISSVGLLSDVKKVTSQTQGEGGGDMIHDTLG